MSALVVANEGENKLNDLWVGAASTDLRLRLFQNNYTPVAGSTVSSFTEASFSGYSAATPSFGASSTVSNKGTITDSSARDFTHNGGGTSNTVYGYYVSYEPAMASAVLLWAEKFDSSRTVANNGDKITVTAKFTLNSEN